MGHGSGVWSSKLKGSPSVTVCHKSTETATVRMNDPRNDVQAMITLISGYLLAVEFDTALAYSFQGNPIMGTVRMIAIYIGNEYLLGPQLTKWYKHI